MAYFAASIWPGEQLWLYWERMFVMVAISGLVIEASHVRLPTSSWSCLLSLWRSEIGKSLWGTVSTGNPLRYGVFVVRESFLSRPAFFTRVLTSAC